MKTTLLLLLLPLALLAEFDVYGWVKYNTCGISDATPLFYAVGDDPATGSSLLDLMIDNAKSRSLTLVVLNIDRHDPLIKEIDNDDDFYSHPKISRWEKMTDTDPLAIERWTSGHRVRITRYGVMGVVLFDVFCNAETLAELKAALTFVMEEKI